MKICHLISFFYSVILCLNVNAQSQRITLQGQLPDSFANHTFQVATKNDPLDVHILTSVQTDSLGRFSVSFFIDKPQPLAFFEQAYVFPHQSDYCEFWGDTGTINVTIEFYNKARFLGPNEKANNLLADIRQGRKEVERFRYEWEYTTTRDRQATQHYLNRIDSLTQVLWKKYEATISKNTPSRLQQWILDELRSFDVLQKSDFYFYKLSQMDSTWFAGEEKNRVYHTLTQRLSSFEDRALQSETFLHYLRLCVAMNTDSAFVYRNSYPEYKQLLHSVEADSSNLIDIAYQEDNLLSIWIERCGLNWLRTYIPEKKHLYEFLLADNIYALGSRAGIRDEQKRLLTELKTMFPASRYISDAEEAIKRYTEVDEMYKQDVQESSSVEEVQDVPEKSKKKKRVKKRRVD